MLILGLVLLLIGWLTGIGILITIGIILLVIGAVLWNPGVDGAPGRRPPVLVVAPGSPTHLGDEIPRIG
jgi:hypothetical protein